MKKILICLILLCSMTAQAQNAKLDSIVADALRRVYADTVLSQSPYLYNPNLNLPTEKAYSWKRGALVAGFGLVAGMSYGLHEMSVHHPWDLPKGWDKQFWDNRISWTNKYENGDPNLGPKFPLSTGALVFVTDGKHLTGTIHRAALLGGGITIGFGEKRKWWEYAGDLVLGFAAYNIGFHSIYTYQMLGR